MHGERRGHGGVDVAQELEELLVAMPVPALGEYPARGNVQGRKQCGRAVPQIPVRDAFDVAQAKREERLRAVEGLNLTLLVDTQDHRLGGGMEIEAHEMAHL